MLRYRKCRSLNFAQKPRFNTNYFLETKLNWYASDCQYTHECVARVHFYSDNRAKKPPSSQKKWFGRGILINLYASVIYSAASR